ncbi:MAG: RNA polymerase-binding protein DksA [Deltaproteobacteria bacterium]|nr:RNA polymerase-binding protein DksA [Deltaproteobacteria bacterium]
MDKQSLEFFRSLLHERLEELIGKADITRTSMTNDSNALFADPTDRAALETDRNFILRIRDRERKLIAKIQAALERIEDGTYGICEICGGEISEKRLRARPVTTMCISCKSRMEALEKAKGL